MYNSGWREDSGGSVQEENETENTGYSEQNTDVEAEEKEEVALMAIVCDDWPLPPTSPLDVPNPSFAPLTTLPIPLKPPKSRKVTLPLYPSFLSPILGANFKPVYPKSEVLPPTATVPTTEVEKEPKPQGEDGREREQDDRRSQDNIQLRIHATQQRIELQ